MPRKRDLRSKTDPELPFSVVPFECAEVKTEPLEELNDGQPETFFPFRDRHMTSVAIQTSKRKLISRSIQVDLPPVLEDGLGGGQSSTVDEPLEPDLTKGALEKQCRICLRRMPESSLSYILFPQKTKILAALGIKVYLGDAYPFICRNCTSLIDLIHSFRSSCMKAKNMLVQERKSIDNLGWDSAENWEVIERCKTLVETHKKDIDDAYEMSSRSLEAPMDEDVKVEPGTIEMVIVKSSASVKSDNSSQDESDDCSYHSEPEHSESEASDKSDQDSDNEEKYIPKPAPVSVPPKKKRIRIVTKPYKKRQKKAKGHSDDGSQELERKVKKKRKNAADPNRKRGALCDFCGEWVEYHTVESHKNQHLGIKPYICQTEGCKLAFSCRNLLVKHIKRQHGTDGPEYHDCDICGHRIKGPKAALKKHQKTHTEEKNFICAVCGKGFTTQGYLRQHSIIHTDLMPFECGVCRRKFNNKYNMLTHEKKHYVRGEMVMTTAEGTDDGEIGAIEPVPPVSLPPFAEYHQNSHHHQHQLHQAQQVLPPVQHHQSLLH